MRTISSITLYSSIIMVVGLTLWSCQKLERPELGDYPKDPPVPAYNPLKSLFAFENNITDEGENKLDGSATNITYVAGITGQAIQVGADGYVLLPALGQTNTDPNGFISTPSDTLANLGSFSISFWMNGAGPVAGGAQGLFSISNKNQFWGNLDLFLENYEDPADPNAAWLKIHMFNSAVSGGGEEWTADDNMKLPDVLNKWTHIAITYDETTSSLSVYKDGAPTVVNNKTLGGGSYGKIKFDDFNGVALGTFQFQTNPTLSNHGPEPWAKSFNGTLDQFRIYDKALTAAEVNTLFTDKL